jgi:hypothetical protein
VAQYLRWRPAGELELKELDEFLLARAMEGFQVHPTQNQQNQHERRISPGQRPTPRPRGPTHGEAEGPDGWLPLKSGVFSGNQPSFH